MKGLQVNSLKQETLKAVAYLVKELGIGLEEIFALSYAMLLDTTNKVNPHIEVELKENMKLHRTEFMCYQSLSC
jgi:hypothetical protein